MTSSARRAAAGSPRPLVAISAAILLPSLIYLLVSVGLGYRGERRAIEAATLQRAITISHEVDAELRVAAATMRALATIRGIHDANWDQARARSHEIAALQPDWRDVALVDLDQGVEVYGTGPDRFARPVDSRPLRAMATRARGTPVFSDVVRGADGQPRIMAYLAISAGRARNHLLIVAISPDMIQRILVAHAPRDGVSGVVDRKGIFIARTVGYPARIGTPGTHYLRDAIRRGRSGLYHGVTWERLDSYSGFATSDLTGWSSHVAVSATLVNAPQRWWMLSSVLAALISILLALIFLVLTQRMLRGERLANERVRQAERLETVGKLTGGVAHDFNNMLAIVRGNLELAQRRLERGDPNVLRYILNAIDGAGRAADLTQRLLTFSRRQALTPVGVDASALILDMEDLLARTLSSAVGIDLHLTPGLPAILVDRASLENAIVNLAVNARDAMPQGGTLSIETRDVVLDDRSAARFGAAAGAFVRIALSDTGTGMPPAVMAKAFEPFFTTKEVGRGTGLGLSQVHGFVTQSGGFIEATSEPGRGTSIALYLPAHDGPVEASTRKAAEAPPRGWIGETILLVEDEDELRGANAEILRELGYVVHEAASGAEALDILAVEQAVQLLVTDVAMPEMNGIDLARAAAARVPGLRILFVTGYEGEEADPALEGRTLRKPFGVDDLAHRVRAILDEGRTVPA